MEAIAETDDHLMLKYLEGEEISNEELRVALRAATISSKLVPVLCGTACATRACSRCWMRSSIICRRRSTFRPWSAPIRTRARKRSEPPTQRPAGRAVLQDRHRSLHGPAGLRAHLFRHAGQRQHLSERQQRKEGAHWATGAHARQPARGDDQGRRGRYCGRAGSQAHLHRRDPQRRQRADHPGDHLLP